MRLFTFGDSWTEGVGGNLNEELTTNIPEERTAIRQKYCWPKHLSELLKCNVNNYGVGAFSNNLIFNTVSYQLKNEIITQDDFVVIMWSSSLRDDLPFFPNENNFNIWGERYKTKQHLFKYIFDGIKGGKVNYNRAEKNFRDFYINNLYNDMYYDIVNQNYILHLQFMFKELGIRYLFCDGFDNMINKDIDENVNKTNLINQHRYWGFRNKTMVNLLTSTNRKDVWENGEYWTEDTEGKHPNNKGYELIANELYKFIMENNLLNDIKIKNSYLI
jgi:lysophospholipase L1-like esterase